MKKLGAVFLCFVVIICVFRATDFSFEEYINYVEENFPKYKPTFTKYPDGEKILRFAVGVPVSGVLEYYCNLYQLSSINFPTLRDYVIPNRVYFHEWYLKWPGDGETKSLGVFIADVYKPEIYQGGLYIELYDLDTSIYEYIPGYIYEVIPDTGPKTVGDYLEYIYYFVKGVVTVPIWLIHAIGVLSYGVFAS